MRTAATPGELARMSEFLEPLPEQRRGPVLAMVFEVVGDCPGCDEPVRRCDARCLDRDGRIGHLDCIPAPRRPRLDWRAV